MPGSLLISCWPYEKLSWPVISDVSRAQRRHVLDQTSRGWPFLPRKTELRMANEHTADSAFSRERLEVFLDQAAFRV